MKFKIWKSLGIALASLPISAAWSVAGAEVVEYSFFGETSFAYTEDEECTSNPSVCALVGQGALSGSIQYEPSALPIYPDMENQPIFFEANWTGAVNSLPWQPRNIDINFSTESVNEFYWAGGPPSFTPVLAASIFDPKYPEFERIDLRIQWESRNFQPLFWLSIPLQNGSRGLSMGILEMTKVTKPEEPVSVPEPASLLGLGVVVGLGTLGARKKHKSHRA